MAEHLRSFAPEIVLVALATVFAGVAYLQLGPQWLWRTNHCPASTVSCSSPPLSMLGFGLVAVGVVWMSYLLTEERDRDV